MSQPEQYVFATMGFVLCPECGKDIGVAINTTTNVVVFACRHCQILAREAIVNDRKFVLVEMP